MKKSSSITDFQCSIYSTEFISKNTVSMNLECRNFKFMPGQFLMIETPGHTLRRPFVICSINNNLLRIIFKIKGKGTGTELLSKLPTGTLLKVMAPLGNYFPLPEKGTDVFFIGGGIGSVTLLPLAEQLSKTNKINIFIGARNSEDLLLLDDLKKHGTVHLATDDGSCGICGNSVDLCFSTLKKAEINIQTSTIYACGPNPMLKCISENIENLDINCFFSMEERMACGIGACVCCVVNTIHGLKRTCKDGPVFNAKEIIWE